MVAAAPMTVRRIPMRSITQPASGRATVDPMEPTNRMRPTWAGRSSSWSRTAGRRAIHVDRAKPLRAKAAKVAHAARVATSGLGSGTQRPTGGSTTAWHLASTARPSTVTPRSTRRVPSS